MVINKEISNSKFYENVKNNADKINFYIKENKNREASELCDKTFDMIKNYKLFMKENEPEAVVLLYNLYHAKADFLDLLVYNEEEKFLYLKKALDIIINTNNPKFIIYEYRNFISKLLKSGKIKEALRMCKKLQKILPEIQGEIKFEKLKEMIKNNSPIQNIIEDTGYTKEEIDEIQKIMILVKETCDKNN